MAATPSENHNASVVTPGMVAQQQYGLQSPERTAEVSQTGVAAHMQATVQAKYIMAERRPRNEDDVRAKLMRDCQRPSFASAAMYRVPRGGTSITGLSVRFAEAAVRAMGNIWCESFTLFDDQNKRIVRVRVVDLESNTTHERDITVEKLVERSRPDPKRGFVGQRVNAQGAVVFIVRASDDDLAIKEAALSSKAMRTLILRLIPVWMQDECKEEIVKTQRNEDAADPDTAKRRILDRFAELSIMPSELVEYLGHKVEVCTPEELAELRGIFQAIRDGEASWPNLLAAKRGTPEEKTSEGEKKQPANRAAEVLSKIQNRDDK